MDDTSPQVRRAIAVALLLFATLALSGDAPFSALAMAIPFGIGQFLMAFVLYRATGGHDGED